MVVESPNFVRAQLTEGAASSNQTNSQSAPTERKRGRPRLPENVGVTEDEKKRRRAAYMRSYRQEHPEYKEQSKKHHKDYRDKHRKERRAQQRDRYWKRKEQAGLEAEKQRPTQVFPPISE